MADILQLSRGARIACQIKLSLEILSLKYHVMSKRELAKGAFFVWC